MSQAGHSALLHRAFTLGGVRNVGAAGGFGLAPGQQRRVFFRNVFGVAPQLPAPPAGLRVGFLLDIAATLNDVRQHFLELRAIHFCIPSRLVALPAHRRMAFSALLSFKRSRSFMRALWSCDLLLPMEQPIISAISLCS